MDQSRNSSVIHLDQDDEDSLLSSVSDEVLENAAVPEMGVRWSWLFSRDCGEC